jgi:4-amino-4-deoxy-L-arabinose transferase-like glycosyltransferase
VFCLSCFVHPFRQKLVVLKRVARSIGSSNVLTTSIRRFASAPLLATGVTAVAGLLYFLTAARDIVVGDCPELITAAVTLGVAHAPGYPLFTMLGHFFSQLPLAPIPFRVNLLSAVCDALTVGIVFLTGFRLSRSRLASAIAALILALNPLFWSWSLVAEVFPLNNLLAALLIYLLVIWNDDPQRDGTLVGAAFIAGLALTNQHTIVLLGPAICFLLWRHRAILLARPRIVIVCAAAFLVALVPYAYVPWAAARHPAHNWGGVSSFSDFIAFVTRREIPSSFRLVPRAYEGGSVWPRIATLCFSFGAPMGLLALLGMIRTYRRCRWYFWFSLLAFGSTGLFFAIISNSNLNIPSAAWVLERFFLLPEVAVAPLVALGVVMIADLVASSAPALRNKSLPIIAGALGLVLVVSLFTNYRRIDQSRNNVARNYGEDVLASLEPGTILFAGADAYMFPLIYLTMAEKMRPDVTLVATPLLPYRWYIAQLRARYPNLNIPFESYDWDRNNFKVLIEANCNHSIAYVWLPPDASAMRDYWPRPHGLVQLIEPNSKWISVDEWASDNKQLMKRYRAPASGAIRANTFERDILFSYSFAAWQIGTRYERRGSKVEARAWYQRARDIDPGSEAAYRVLYWFTAR